MVSKLFKHEFAALGRVLLPVEGIVLGVAVLCRVLQLFEWDNVVYDILFGSSIFFLVVANLVGIFMTIGMGVVRFYKNLFTAEGYLSFTLPITPAQHIFVKLTANFLFQIISVAVCLLSVGIATAGEVLVELFNAFQYLGDRVVEVAGIHFYVYLLEFLLLIILSSIGTTLLYYMCIAIGQLARKNRVLTAIGVYFGVYSLTQIISTVGSVLIEVFHEDVPFETVMNWMEQHLFTFIHLVLCGFVILSLMIAGVYFLITHTIIRKKLNLE